jgi:hypothetical protein
VVLVIRAKPIIGIVTEMLPEAERIRVKGLEQKCREYVETTVKGERALVLSPSALEETQYRDLLKIREVRINLLEKGGK